VYIVILYMSGIGRDSGLRSFYQYFRTFPPTTPPASWPQILAMTTRDQLPSFQLISSHLVLLSSATPDHQTRFLTNRGLNVDPGICDG
jgi:hypothetical protein